MALFCITVTYSFSTRGIQVLLDGAHTLGMLPMDVEYLGADYFVANCHKWFSSVRGAAILYVDSKHLSSFKPLIVSHGSGSGFTSDFIWDGTQHLASLQASTL